VQIIYPFVAETMLLSTGMRRPLKNCSLPLRATVKPHYTSSYRDVSNLSNVLFHIFNSSRTPHISCRLPSAVHVATL